MRVLLLGTSGYHPTETRQTACVALPDLGIVFDAGTGIFRLGQHLTNDQLNVFLSHAHLDHVVGLTYFFSLLHEFKQRMGRPLASYEVHGDAAKLAAVREHLFAPALFPAAPPMAWMPLQPGEQRCIAGATITCFALKHPGGSLGYRVTQQGKSLAYVTDTTAAANSGYLSAIRGVDLLIHECNFPNGATQLAEKTGHSCLTEVAQLAATAKVKRLVLTHFDPVAMLPPEQLEEARKVFPSLVMGQDQLEITL